MKRAIVVGIFILAIIGSIVIFETMQRDRSFDPLLSPPDEVSPQSTFFRKTQFIPRYRDLPGYEVIVENNLFRPLGWKKEVKPPRKSNSTVTLEPKVSAPPANPPTYTLILTGIAKNGSEWIAVVENRKEDNAAFLRRGDMLKDALVKEIISEYITLSRGNMTVQLALGESIEYGAHGRLRLEAAGTAKTQKASDRTYARSGRKLNTGYDRENNRFRRMPNRSKKDPNQ